MDLVIVEPAFVKLKEAQMTKHSDKVQDCWSCLNIRRDVYHSVAVINIFCVEKQPKQCWNDDTETYKHGHRSAVLSTDLWWKLFTDNRWAEAYVRAKPNAGYCSLCKK